jgi:hypothetical protein
VSAAAAETRFRGHLSSTQAVTVAIDGSGRPRRVVDVDRMLVTKKGDYSFAIGAPIEDVRSASGSESEPGLRTDAVVWQGFSPGRRVLGAEIVLRATQAAAALPLRVEIDESAVRLVNTTAATAPALDVPAGAIELGQALDAARAAVRKGIPIPAPVIETTAEPRPSRAAALVPLRIKGTVRFSGGRRRVVTAVVGRTPLRIDGVGRLRALDLAVAVPQPANILRPPHAGGWLDLARTGRLLGGRAGTRTAVELLLSAALASQFHEFLANPDVGGNSRTSYRYELAASTPRVVQRSRSEGRPWLALTIVVGLMAAAAGAIVIWAHS